MKTNAESGRTTKATGDSSRANLMDFKMLIMRTPVDAVATCPAQHHSRQRLADETSGWRERSVALATRESAQIFVRRPVPESLAVPAVAEPLIVWVISGAARVEERTLGGECKASEVHPGDFFLTTAVMPGELRWKTLEPGPFRVMHTYLGLPLMRRATADAVGDAGPLASE